MRITLVESEIMMALEDFVLNTLRVPDDIRVDIDLKATRGEEGHTAIIDLVHLTSPDDGSDRSVDDRIVATDEAKAEGLGIVDKIEAARAEAKAPRRRGRPAGSKNLPKTEPTPNAETQAAMTDVRDGNTTKHETVEEAIADLNEPDPEPEAVTEAQAAVAEEVAAPVQDRDANVSASNEELVAQAEANAPVELPEPEAAPAEATAQPKRSLFGGLSNTKTDDGPAPVEEVEAIQDEPEPNSEAALAAEAQATEPADTAEDEDVDYTPTPETPGLETEVAEGKDETPAPAPTRSLFADLKKPTN